MGYLERFKQRYRGAALRRAWRQDELSLHYLPVVEVAGRRIVGAEALLRWRPDRRTVRRPQDFVALAEHDGFILPLTQWVVGRVLEEWAPALRRLDTFWISINLAPAHFRDDAIVAYVEHATALAGVAPRCLHFELTERAAIDYRTTQAGLVIDGLRELGSQVALDDFGSGFAALDYLRQLHFDYVKIDRPFVETIGGGDSALLEDFVQLARDLDLGLMVEGVETQAQAAFLAGHGIERAQGFLYHEPMPAFLLQDLLGVDAQQIPTEEAVVPDFSIRGP